MTDEIAREIERQRKVQELTQVLEDTMEKLRHADDKVMEEAVKTVILHQHRTTLQRLVRVVGVTLIRTVAGMGCDLRNEAAVKLCGDWIKVADDGDHHLPFI